MSADQEVWNHERDIGPVIPPVRLDLPRVPFADGDTDSLPFDWAERGLRWLYANRMNTWMDMMRYGVFRYEDAPKPPGRPKKDS